MPKGVEREQIAVAADNQIRMAFTASPKEFVVGRIAAGGDALGSCQCIIIPAGRRLRDAVQSVLGHQRQQLAGRALRVLLAAFPLADQSRRYVQVAGKHRLAGPFPFPQFPPASAARPDA